MSVVSPNSEKKSLGYESESTLTESHTKIEAGKSNYRWNRENYSRTRRRISVAATGIQKKGKSVRRSPAAITKFNIRDLVPDFIFSVFISQLVVGLFVQFKLQKRKHRYKTE